MNSACCDTTATDNVRTVRPVVNIYETENEITLEAEMPGVGRDDVKVEVEADELRISGKPFMPALSKEYTTLYAERYPKEYYRAFLLGPGVQRDKIVAKCDNGTLTVSLKKEEKPKPRKIDIV